MSDCIFEIHQLWQSRFNRVYSNSCCSSSFQPEIIKIGKSSHTIYSNKIPNFQESSTILNACTKMSGNLLNAPRKSTKKWLSESNVMFCNDPVSLRIWIQLRTCGDFWKFKSKKELQQTSIIWRQYARKKGTKYLLIMGRNLLRPTGRYL